MWSLQRVVVILTVGTVAVAAADRPYVGTWKMNPAKSDFGETTIAYEQLPSGEMQATMEGQSYKFRMDGKQYPGPFGSMIAWKALSPNSWESTFEINGRLISTDTLTLSTDGKSLTVHSKGTKPNGEPLDNTAVLQRTSGGTGLEGKWKTKNFKSSSPNVLELSPSGEDGLKFRIVDMDLTCDGKLDGKDYPCSGPVVAEGWTVSFATPDANSLAMTVKNKGTLLYRVVYTVSADGKTLTETSTATATKEKVKVVYDRQ